MGMLILLSCNRVTNHKSPICTNHGSIGIEWGSEMRFGVLFPRFVSIIIQKLMCGRYLAKGAANNPLEKLIRHMTFEWYCIVLGRYLLLQLPEKITLVQIRCITLKWFTDMYYLQGVIEQSCLELQIILIRFCCKDDIWDSCEMVNKLRVSNILPFRGRYIEE